MLLNNFSTIQFKYLCKDEINTILKLTQRDYRINDFVEVNEFPYLRRYSGLICELEDGNYINLVYSPFSINEENLEGISKKTENIWNIINKDAIEMKNDTANVETLIIVGSPLEEKDSEILLKNSDYSISQVSTYELTAIKEFRPIDKKMWDASKNRSDEELLDSRTENMDEDEMNGLLSLVGVGDEIEEIVEIDFENPDIECESVVCRKKNGDYLSIRFIFDEPNEELYMKEVENINNIREHLNKGREDNSIHIESCIIDMGINIREREKRGA